MIRKVLISFLSLICIFNLSIGAIFAEGPDPEPSPEPEPTPTVFGWSDLVSAAADPGSFIDVTNDAFEVTGGGADPYTIKLLKNITATADDTSIVVPEGVTLTIDLNGHILDRNAVNKTSGAATAAADKRIITNHGTLTVTSTDTTNLNQGFIVGGAWIPGVGSAVKDLSGGILCGGSGNENGSAIDSLNNDLTLSNVTFAGNICSGTSGAVYVGTHANITDCNFVYNRGGCGAAICTNKTSNPDDLDDRIKITNCKFDHNGVSSNGGALYLVQGMAVIDNCEFTYNTGYSGGAICSLAGSQPTVIKNSIFDHNSVSGGNSCQGGAIYARSDFDIDTCEFTYNSNPHSKNGQWGGAIFVCGGVCTIKNSHFKGNVSSKGGAILIYPYTGSPLADIYDSLFEENQAKSGSAISTVSGRLNIHSGEFKNNVILSTSAADYRETGTIYSYNSVVNMVADEGKSIYVHDNTLQQTTNAEKIAQTGVSVSGTTQLNIGGELKVKNNGCSSGDGFKTDNGIIVKANTRNGVVGNINLTAPLTQGSDVQLNLLSNRQVNNPNQIDLSSQTGFLHAYGGQDGYIEQTTGKLVVNSGNHQISYIIQGEGTISSNVENNIAFEGDLIELTYTPDEGYYFSKMKVLDSSDNEIILTDNTFTMPNDNAFVYIYFTEIAKPAPEHDDGPSEIVEEEPEKKFIIQAAPKKEEKKEEPKDFGIKVNDGTLTINYHPKSKTSISITNVDALKSMSDRIVSDLKYYKDSGNAPLYIDDLDEDAILKIIENNEEITLEPYYSFDDEKYVINEDTDKMNDFVSRISDSHDGKTIFSLELGINIMANGKKIGSINELSQPLEYKIQLDGDAFKDSKDRYLYLVTYHKGEYSYRPLQIDGSGSVVFTSQQFSPFRVISTKTSLLVNSTSVDYVLGLFFVGILLLIALITVLVVRNKKKRYINSQVLVNQNIKF